MTSLKPFLEYQSGGYPLGQVLVVEIEQEGVTDPMVCAFFADVEADVYRVEFGPEGEIKFDTNDYAYLTIDPEQLEQILALVPEAVALNRELSTLFGDDGEWKDYQHLVTKPKTTASEK